MGSQRSLAKRPGGLGATRPWWIAVGLLLAARCSGGTTAEGPLGAVCVVERMQGHALILRSATGSAPRVEPAGALATLDPGDTLRVISGVATLFDLRSHAEQVLAAGSQYVTVTSAAPADQGLLKRLLDRLSPVVAARPTAGVRGIAPRVFPHDVRFGSGGAIVCAWIGAPEAARIAWSDARGDSVEQDLSDGAESAEVPTSIRAVTGLVRWRLTDADGNLLVSSAFVQLDAQVADSLRRNFKRLASHQFARRDRQLGAEILAAAEGVYLW